MGSNIAAMRAQRNLSQSSASLSRTHERLASGQRINRASDDAASLAVSAALKTDQRVFTQGIRNLNDGLSVLNLADNAVQQFTDIVIRMRELAQQAANGTFAPGQRQAIDSEAQALSAEYTRIIQSTKYNGIPILTSAMGELRLQAGIGVDGSLAATFGGAVGTGSFRSPVSQMETAPSTASHALALGDMNGDGLLDVVTGGYMPGVATVHFGNGTGGFSGEASYNMDVDHTYDLALADVNNDGSLDLVSSGRTLTGTGTATIRLNRGDGTFGAALSYTQEGRMSISVALEDLNADGNLDLLTTGSQGAGPYTRFMTVRMGAGNGTFGAARSYQLGAALTSGSGRDIAVGDLNGDGIKDLAVANYSATAGYASIMLGCGDGTFGPETDIAQESTWSRGVALVDLNHDSKLDLVTTGRAGTDGYTTVRLGNGDATFRAARSYAAESFFSLDMTLADLNGDAELDLITTGCADGTVGYTSVRLGRGDGSFGARTSFAAETKYSFKVRAGDLDNDGVPDLVTAGNSTANKAYFTVRLAETRSGTSPILPFSLATMADARQAMGLLDAKLAQLGRQEAELGAFRSRVASAHSALGAAAENCMLAASRLQDADVAEEAAQAARLNILQNAGAAILQQANQQPALALSLLG